MSQQLIGRKYTENMLLANVGYTFPHKFNHLEIHFGWITHTVVRLLREYEVPLLETLVFTC